MRGKPRDGSVNPGGRPPMYPWRTLEVGQSFLAADRFTTTNRFGQYYAQANKQAHEECRPHRFQARAEEVDGQRRVRVYRVR